MLKIDNLIDDAKCYETIRQMRWPQGVKCVWCQSEDVKRRGMHQRQRDRQSYHCKACDRDFDDLTETIFAHHYQPLRKWIICLDPLGLNLSNDQICPQCVRECVRKSKQGSIVPCKPLQSISGIAAAGSRPLAPNTGRFNRLARSVNR